MFFKVDVLKSFVIFTGKKTPTQVFSCEYCEVFKECLKILKEQLFYRTPPVGASPNSYIIWHKKIENVFSSSNDVKAGILEVNQWY